MNFSRLFKNLSPQTFSAMFLVCGTCIGGGMLALPVATAINGFIPSTVVMLLAWLAMTCTALYLVEAGFWMKKDEAHLISMSENLLGAPAKGVAWILYLFIAYASLVAYTAGAASLVTQAFDCYTNVHISPNSGALLFILIFGPVIFCSHKVLGRLNSILFVAMIIAFVALITISAPNIESKLLLRTNWNGFYFALPLFLTAFSFQTMVPSLHPYLNHHSPSLKVAIIGGTGLACVVYVIWQATVLGSVPLEGAFGLKGVLQEGGAATFVLGRATGSTAIELLASFFAFFALVTSFLGIALGLYDFLSDGLNIPKKGFGNIALGALIIVPTYFSAIYFERVFLTALDLTGGFGDAILNGIIPVLMIVSGRYLLKLKKTAFQAPGGKWLLYIAFFFYLAALSIEIISQIGFALPIHTVD